MHKASRSAKAKFRMMTIVKERWANLVRIVQTTRPFPGTPIRKHRLRNRLGNRLSASHEAPVVALFHGISVLLRKTMVCPLRGSAFASSWSSPSLNRTQM